MDCGFYKKCSITRTGMIKKWKVTPVPTRPRPVPTRPRHNSGGDIVRYYGNDRIRYDKAKDDAVANTTTYTTTEKIDIKPKKPRRHTTGGTKQSQEDIMIAKHLTQEIQNGGGKIINEYGQEIDPHSTLGRKQLVSMLKQRYGQDIENYRTSNDVSEKERMKRERQKERDRRHEQRTQQTEHVDHRYMQTNSVSHQGKNNGFIRRGSGGSAASGTSEGSDGVPGSPASRRMSDGVPGSPASRRMVTKSSIASQARYQQSSDEEHDQSRRHHHISFEKPNETVKEVVFLQFRDEMKRVNLQPRISSVDAIKALFINAFPGKISMPQFESTEQMIYIKDMETGVYFHLEDVSDIVNRSFLKIHEKEIVTSQAPQYAESLQDFDLTAPRMRRTNSGSSLRSDNVLTRPTYLKETTTTTTHHMEESATTTDQQDHHKQNGGVTTEELDEAFDKAMNTSVHDQLDDLTELLKTALSDEDKHSEMMYDIVDTKNPGKINQSLINKLQLKMEDSARQTTLPKHFQPTAIIKAQQETDRMTPNGRTPQRKISSDSDHSQTSKDTTDNKISQINSGKSSVRVTIRATSSSTKKALPVEPLVETNRITEDFFEPPNKQSYVEHKTTPTSAKKFDMSDLDDIVTQSPTTKKKTFSESKDTSQVECNLLEQLQNMEDEMKQYSTHLESASSSVDNSRRSSTSSNRSAPQASPSASYAAVKKKSVTSTSSSIPESPRTPRSRENSNASFSSHSDAAAEFEKLKGMSIHDANKKSAQVTSNQPRDRNVMLNNTMTSLDTTDSVFTVESSSTTKGSEPFSKTSAIRTSATRTSSSGSATKATGKLCGKTSISAPDFMELEKAASKVKTSINELRKDLALLRKSQLDNTRSFKNDIQKKLLEFRKKACKVNDLQQSRIDQNNNSIFANTHPVREQRHRLAIEQTEYSKKISSAQYRLHNLENSMENVRLDVVSKKRVEDPSQLNEFQEELTNLTKNVGDIKNKYHGVEDTLQRVIKLEMEVIQTEQIFLEEEPEKVKLLVQRCQTLSGTLETLRRLAKMQQDVSRKTSYPDYQEIPDQGFASNAQQPGNRYHR